MRDDVYTNNDVTYDSYLEPEFEAFLPIPPSGVAITSINSITGPSITFAGGTSGFSYAPGGTTITLVGPLTSKGDLYTRNSTVGVALPVGSDTFILSANSGEATGLKWIANTTGDVTHTGTLTANQLIIGNGGADITIASTAAGILTFLGTPSSANLASAVTDETGSGALVFANRPTFSTSTVGAGMTMDSSAANGGYLEMQRSTTAYGYIGNAVAIAGFSGSPTNNDTGLFSNADIYVQAAGGDIFNYATRAFFSGSLGINVAPSASKFAVVGLPTSTAGLASGDVWVDTAGGLNILKIV